MTLLLLKRLRCEILMVVIFFSTETAEAAKVAASAEIIDGWKDKTTTQTTLHLTHLPPSLTSPQLSLIMSSYAPLRSAFVVSTGPASGSTNSNPGGGGVNAIKATGNDRSGKFTTSRGFGYVRFVLRTDAEKCLAEWGGAGGIPRSALIGIEGIEGAEGIEFDKVCGRGGVKMDWAKKKLKEGEEPEGGVKLKKEKKPKVEKIVKEKKEWIDYDAEDAPPRPQSANGFDYEGSRTVIVQGLTVPLTEEEIIAAKLKKAEAKKSQMEVDGVEPEEEEEEKEEEVEEEKDDDDETVTPGKAVDWKKALKQKAKKWGDVESVTWPVVLASGETVGASLTLSHLASTDFRFLQRRFCCRLLDSRMR